MRTRFLSCFFLMSAMLCGQAADPAVRIRTNLGSIDVTLLQSIAPLNVANFLNYVNKGSYNNAMFHRSVQSFIVQTGGYSFTPSGGFGKIASDPPVRNEYNVSNTRGTLAMAKVEGNPNSATNEFFFNLADNSSNLNAQNGGFTVFGRVANTASQTVVDLIASQRTISFSTTVGQFETFPLVNYRGGTIQAANIIVIQSIELTAAPTPPSISSNGIVSASAFGGGRSAAAGSYIEIYGTGLAGTTRGWADSDFTGIVAPITLDQVQVTVGGRRAYINFVSPGQINVQVPEDIPTGDEVPLVLTFNGMNSAPVNIAIRPFAGGLLAPASFKVGDVQYIAAQHASTGKFVSGGNIRDVDAAPAVPGETLTLYGTGFGPITPGVPALAGRIAQGVTALTNPVTIKIGEAEAKVSYAGLAPGLVGVYQFNIEVPANAANGDQPLTVTQGGEAIAQKLFVTVKAGQ